MANTSYWAEPMLIEPQPLNGHRCLPMKSSSRIFIAKNLSLNSFNFHSFSQCEQLDVD